jgi:hypothetical protein
VLRRDGGLGYAEGLAVRAEAFEFCVRGRAREKSRIEVSTGFRENLEAVHK